MKAPGISQLSALTASLKKAFKALFWRVEALIPPLLKEKVGVLMGEGQEDKDCKAVVLEPKHLLHLVVQLPKMEHHLLEEVIPFQLQSRLPFPMEEAVFTIVQVYEREEGLDVMVSVVRRSLLQQRMTALFQEAEASQGGNFALLPPGLALASFDAHVAIDAQGHCSDWNSQDETRQEGNLYLLQEEQTLWVALIKEGGLRRSYIIDLEEHFSQIPSEKEVDKDSPIGRFEPLVREIKRTLLSWSLPADYRIYLEGVSVHDADCFNVLGLRTVRLDTSTLGMPIDSSKEEQRAQSWSVLRFGASKLTKRRMVAHDFLVRGALALEEQERRSLKHLFNYGACALSLVILLLSCTFFFHQVSLSSRVLAQYDRELSTYVKQVQGRNRSLPKGATQWSSWLVERTAPYDIEPALPTAGELLSWLGESIRKTAKREQWGNLDIVLEDAQYIVESYPTLDARNRPYRARLELELSALDPKKIESLQQELLRLPSMDRSRKMRWSPVGSQGYKMTLYLKSGRKL